MASIAALSGSCPELDGLEFPIVYHGDLDLWFGISRLCMLGVGDPSQCIYASCQMSCVGGGKVSIGLFFFYCLEAGNPDCSGPMPDPCSGSGFGGGSQLETPSSYSPFLAVSDFAGVADCTGGGPCVAEVAIAG